MIDWSPARAGRYIPDRCFQSKLDSCDHSSAPGPARVPCQHLEDLFQVALFKCLPFLHPKSESTRSTRNPRLNPNCSFSVRGTCRPQRSRQGTWGFGSFHLGVANLSSRTPVIHIGDCILGRVRKSSPSRHTYFFFLPSSLFGLA